MPNYVRNALSFKGSCERVQEVLESIKRDDGELGSIDFNKIVPMPKELDIEEGSKTDRGIEIYLTLINPRLKYRVTSFAEDDFDKLYKALLSSSRFATYRCNIPDDELEALSDDQTRELFALGRQACNNMLTYGCTTWYRWCISHWGTKWGAMDDAISGGNTIVFDTAWNAPAPIVKELSSRFPDVEMTLVFADEDIGNNCGRVIYSNGDEIKRYMPSGKRATKFACKVWDYDPEEYLES